MGGKTGLKRRLKVYERDKAVCHLCGCWVPPPDLDRRYPQRRATVDHIVPEVHGGTDALDNLRLAHANCNHARGDLSLASPLLLREIGPAIESNKKWANNVRHEMEKKQNTFDIRRRGSIQALRAIRDWARQCSDHAEAETNYEGREAYENVFRETNRMIVEFEEKKGPNEGEGPFRWIRSASNLFSILRNNESLKPETIRLIDELLMQQKKFAG